VFDRHLLKTFLLTEQSFSEHRTVGNLKN
jgi:hypothetical protein